MDHAGDRPRGRRAAAVVLLLAGTSLGLVACGPEVTTRSTAPSPTTSGLGRSSAPSMDPTTQPPTGPTAGPTPGTGASEPPTTPVGGTALATLELLAVRGRAPMTGYSRDRFGQAWSDAAGDSEWARNGCDTRNDLLRRDLEQTTVEPNGCVVDAGVLAHEPYGGATDRVYDKHDARYATDLDVDHVVSLGNAWATGAQQLDEGRRAAFANDPVNLLLVDPSLNRQKGDGDAATWLPPNKAFRCSYAARQVRVKAAYDLWVTAPEKAALVRVLASCGSERLDQPDPQDGRRVDPPRRAPTSPSAPDGDASFADCAAVRAAGAAPIRRGDPGWGEHLDRDGDGVGCEG